MITRVVWRAAASIALVGVGLAFAATGVAAPLGAVMIIGGVLLGAFSTKGFELLGKDLYNAGCKVCRAASQLFSKPEEAEGVTEPGLLLVRDDYESDDEPLFLPRTLEEMNSALANHGIGNVEMGAIFRERPTGITDKQYAALKTWKRLQEWGNCIDCVPADFINMYEDLTESQAEALEEIHSDLRSLGAPELGMQLRERFFIDILLKEFESAGS